MKKIFLISYILHLTSYILLAQTFQRTYGGQWSETGTCIQRTLDGNYIISGIAASFTNGYNDVYLLKVSPQGNLLWSKTYGTPWIEYCYYVSTCTDGGFIMTGSTDTTTFGNSDLLLIKTDANGVLQWSTIVGGPGIDFGWYVIQTNDGGFIATGSSTSFSNGSWDGYLVKTNSSGNVLWTKVFSTPYAESLYGISKTNDGGYIVTGSMPDTSGSSDIWLLKLNANGDTLWTKRYGRPTEDAGYAVIQTADGGYAIAGDMHVYTNLGAHHMLLLKTDSLGNYQWHALYGSTPGAEIAYSILPDSSNGYYLLGNTNFYGNGQKDFLLIHTDSVGTMKWQKTYGSAGDDDAWYLQRSFNSNKFVLVGATTSFGAGQWDVYLAEVDSSGSASCYQTSPVPGFDIPSLQIASGTTSIFTGGTGSPIALATTAANTQVTDPCLLISVSENTSDEKNVNVFPNPTSGKFKLIMNNEQGIMNNQVTIYNVYGEKVYSEKISNHKSVIINLEQPNGIYFYKIISAGEIIAAGKLIIQQK